MIFGWWRRFVRSMETAVPCDRFEDNGSLGCLRCDWNLAAHDRDPRYAAMIAEDRAYWDRLEAEEEAREMAGGR